MDHVLSLYLPCLVFILSFFILYEFTTWRWTMIWRVNADRVGGRRKNATSSCRIKQEPLLPIWICHITRPGWFLAHVTPPSLCHANTTTTQQQSHRVQKQKITTLY